MINIILPHQIVISEIHVFLSHTPVQDNVMLK